MSTVTELRWFAPGTGPTLPLARCRHRTDRYHLGSISSQQAVKSRGRRARLEMKVLVGLGDPVELAGGRWRPECWIKSAPVQPELVETGDWATVDKRIWRRNGVEVCQIDLDGTPWWSLAVKVRDAVPAPVDRNLIRRLDAAGDELVCCSYPEWLVIRFGVGSLEGISQLRTGWSGRPGSGRATA